jgi:hypothetical protein
VTMTSKEIAEARRLFGPAPILTSEEPEQFEDFFVQIANDLKPQSFMELLLIWNVTLASWNLNRYMVHATIAIERRYEDGVRQELLRARLQQARKKEQITAEIRSSRPTDIAALAELEETISSAIGDLEELHERKTRERDHNAAFEKSMALQEQLHRLITSETRRRDGGLAQLELFRAGLGAQAKHAVAQILEGEFQEVLPATASLVPVEQQARNDAQLAEGQP